MRKSAGVNEGAGYEQERGKKRNNCPKTEDRDAHRDAQSWTEKPRSCEIYVPASGGRARVVG